MAIERPIKYMRFSETHDEESIKKFFDKLITEGWEIIYYNEIIQPTGVLTNSPNTVNIHVTTVCVKKQGGIL